MSYALLQRSFDDTIDRRAMEEASVAVPSVARADCALLHRELFGIVVQALEREEALAFQAALRMRGLDTELVEESELPVLANPVRRMAMHFDGVNWWVVVQVVRAAIPAERMNRGLERCDQYPWFVYPSERAFEEEIVWRFYRLMRNQRGGGQEILEQFRNLVG
ncbi:MAG: hypothetical protein NZ483_04365 [Verrucomicrobiae bacterium]|nr:hypothetical protein [Verrucomicrobiae bacterium]